MYDEFDNKENEDRYDPEGTPQQALHLIRRGWKLPDSMCSLR